jgi:2-succinyl-5-enolpyruvyl-6-hydroxy-3-cyclohexene-1-carboxylate synthase
MRNKRVGGGSPGHSKGKETNAPTKFMNIHQSPNINYLWASLLIEEFVRNGVEYFCIAPGSRSAPLTVAASRHPRVKIFIHYDERGLAFHALGFVSAQKKPAVLICTSGTAGANFYPAVIEASKKKVPLIILTADRPPELRQTGAVQTIDQVGLFGKYAKFQCDLPCPDQAIKPEYVLTTVDQAVYQAARKSAGVVHLNCMFREPLAPVATGEHFKAYLQGLESWVKGDQPFTQYLCEGEGLIPSLTLPDAIVSRIDKIKNGLIVAGKLSGQKDRDAVLSLARHLGWPVFPDATSGLRLGLSDPNVISYFDQLLVSTKLKKTMAFDGVIHMGGRMTSKRYYEFAGGLSLTEYVMVLNHPLRNDPQHQVSLRVESPVSDFCETLNKTLKARKNGTILVALAKANRIADESMEEFFISQDAPLNEPQVARLISQHAPKDSVVFLANSMPIRAMEFFGDYKGRRIFIQGNRGASGIDGLVATSCGIAAASDQMATLFMGDLALLHDLNSLGMLKAIKKPLVIVVINNDGGGIFSFLPIAQNADVFEQCFGTPHGFSFEQAAGMFGLSYAAPETANEFVRSYQDALKRDDATVIEVKTLRHQNAEIYKTLQRKIINAVEK